MARPMGDSHRRFLQTMMSNGIIEASQAKALHKHCCDVAGANYNQDRLDEFIDVININLQSMFMHIRKGMSEEDGLQYYALVNLAETEVTRMSSDYADNELELFRKIMDLVAESENGTASSTEILNCGDALLSKKLKKKETEQVLNKFVQNKWLIEKHGEYSLSTRCIMEMEQYMRTIYQDLIKDCHVCHNIAFQCQMCENPDCGIRMHLPCVARYFRGRSDPHCPSCNEFWPHEIPEIHRPPASQSQPSSAKENTAPSSTPSTSRGRRSSRRL